MSETVPVELKILTLKWAVYRKMRPPSSHGAGAVLGLGGTSLTLRHMIGEHARA